MTPKSPSFWVCIPAFICCILLAAGCTPTLTQRHWPAESAECAAAVETLDALIIEYSYFDPAVHRIHHYPLLRSNRFLASYAEELPDQEAYNAWLKALNALAMEAYVSEFARVPGEHQSRWLKQRGTTDVRAALTQCSEPYLTQFNYAQPLKNDQVQPKDNYSLALRSLGLYPLTRRLAQGSVNEYRSEMTARVLQGEKKKFEKTQEYLPEQTSELSRDALKQSMAKAYANNVLKIPTPDADTLKALFALNAPVLQIEHQSASDYIGQPRFRDENNVAVDESKPTLFTYTSHTRSGEDVLLQLNYMFWFAERPKKSSFDIYGGDLDSVLWRVTLNPDGIPILYDTIHGCGCYHLLFVPAGTQVNIDNIRHEKPLVFPLQQFSPLHQVELKIESGTHYVVQVNNAASMQKSGKKSGQRSAERSVYALLPYEHLLQLSSPEGRKSFFGKRGIISQSERLERFVLWPLGVPSAGAMRERGMHAIAFVGRRHFDDPYLLEEFGVKFVP